MTRPPLPVFAVTGVALLLGGCSAPDTPKMDNTRLLTEADGVKYFAAQTESSALTCLVRVPGDSTAGWRKLQENVLIGRR